MKRCQDNICVLWMMGCVGVQEQMLNENTVSVGRSKRLDEF